MWNGKKVSVVFPTYNEKESVREAILDFFSSDYVDEVVVVNNNAAEGTSEEVSKTPAIEVCESEQGYGAAIRRGFREASGEYIIVSEPDGTFSGSDVVKLLAYCSDFDVVFGTRTAKELIWQGANMGLFLKWGNYAVAKLMEFLFNTVTLSDVGCTMRLIKRGALLRMQPYFSIEDNYFGPEMMLLACVFRIPFVQIPVNYKRRVGISSVTGSKVKALMLGIKMIGLILKYKWKYDHLIFRRNFIKRKE